MVAQFAFTATYTMFIFYTNETLHSAPRLKELLQQGYSRCSNCSNTNFTIGAVP